MKGGANIQGQLPVADTRFRDTLNHLSKVPTVADAVPTTWKMPKGAPSLNSYSGPDTNWKIPKSSPLTNLYYDINEGIQGTSRMVEAVNPLSYAHAASKFIENKTYVEGNVKFFNIVNITFIILSRALLFLSRIVSLFIWLLYIVISVIVSTLLYSVWFWPIFIFILLLGFVCQTLWDDVTVPIIRGMIESYNGVIYQWNKVTDAVRHIGFDVPLKFNIAGKTIDLGFYVNLGGIDLPHGDTVDPVLKPFFPFLLDILYYMVLEPIKLMTAGYIFRDEY